MISYQDFGKKKEKLAVGSNRGIQALREVSKLGYFSVLPILAMNLESLPPIEKHPSNGTFRFANTDIGIGAVLALTAGQKMLFVQKASRQGYEFSGSWALPGGMLRSKEPVISLADEASFCQFISGRVEEETGLKLPASAIKSTGLLSPITSYEAKGAKRWTAVFSFVGWIAEEVPVATNDRSISAVEWRTPLAALPECTPASRLIIARLEMSKWNSQEIVKSQEHIHSALEYCDACAREVAFPAIPELRNNWKRDN